MRRALPIWIWILAAIPATAQLKHARQPVSGHAVIEGIVADANSHEPVKKAQVTLNGPMAAPLMAVSDGTGRFAFRELPAGSYWLTALKPGYSQPPLAVGAEPKGMVNVSASEQKKGVEIDLLPDTAIQGRLVNEEGWPVSGCQVSAAERSYDQNRRTLRAVDNSATNDKGEYRLHHLAPGRYYVFALCQSVLPAAHPLLPPDDPRTPHQAYLPQFHGGNLDPSTATRLTVVAGANLEGVDFKVTRVPAFTVSGTVRGGDPEALDSYINVFLLPANRLLRNLMMSSAGVDSQTHKFQIGSVTPGAYRLVAFTTQQGRMFQAQRMLDIGPTAPDPVELTLAGGSEIKGSLQFDSDDHPPFENSRVMLAPLEGPWFTPQPQAQVDKEGNFTLTGVLPGRWRLIVSAPGYPKSVLLGGQQVSPYGFQTAQGTAGPLEIVMGAKMADVQVSVDGATPGHPLCALIFPENSALWGAGLERASAAVATDQIHFGHLPPGRFRVLVTDAQNPWSILQRPDWLEALASLSSGIDVPEGGQVRMTVELLPRRELMRILEDKE